MVAYPHVSSLTRRSALLLGLGALAAGGLAPRRADARPAGVLRVGHFPNVTHAHALVARAFERRGEPWFAPRLGGVAVEWYAYNAGPSAMEAVFTSGLDITYVGPNPALNAYARSGGEEIRIVAGAVRGAAALVVRPELGLAAPADFRGRRIGTPQFGNTQDVAARAWLAAGGLRITQTGGDAFVLPTANPDQLTLFARGDLDAVWTVEPWVSRLELEAGGRVLVEETDAITTVLAARRAFADEEAELMGRFVAAHRELTLWIAANPEAAQAMVRDELAATFRAALAPEIVARAWPRMEIASEIAVAELESFVAKAQAVGFLRDVPALDRLVRAGA